MKVLPAQQPPLVSSWPLLVLENLGDLGLGTLVTTIGKHQGAQAMMCPACPQSSGEPTDLQQSLLLLELAGSEMVRCELFPES